MNNQELLFNLIKKLDSGEIRFEVVGKECVLKATSVKALKIGELEDGRNDKIVRRVLFAREHDENWNQEFKESFYKEKQ